MNNRRAKIAATATVLGLGALGGVALESNQGLPAQVAQSGGAGPASVVTSASGAVATTTQPVALSGGAESRPPIVTRASGGAAPGVVPVDD
jgi:hypothetical protein